MREFNDILDEATGQQARLLSEAFEAGRATGRREAAADLSYKLGIVLAAASGETPTALTSWTPDTTALEAAGADVEEDDGDDAERRAPPGSVKPKIARFVAANPGRTTEEIRDNTGAKKNSVRGTLWLLSTEGQIERREGRWYPVKQMNEVEAGADIGDSDAQKDEAAGELSVPDAPTASVTGTVAHRDGVFD